MTPRGWGSGSGRQVVLGLVLVLAAVLAVLLVGCSNTVTGRPAAVGGGGGSQPGGPAAPAAPAAPAEGVCALLTPEEVAAVIGPGPVGMSLPGSGVENCTWVTEQGSDAVVITMAAPGTDLSGLEVAGLGAAFEGNGRQGFVNVISSTKDGQQESVRLATLIKSRL